MFWVTDPDAPASSPQWMIEGVLLKPESRGLVKLRSSDPADPPVIELPDPRLPADYERLVF